MQEFRIVQYCDVCWKDDKAKNATGVVTYNITIDGFTREVDVCASHDGTTELSLSEIRGFLQTYGRKPMPPDVDAPKPKPKAVEKEKEEVHWCSCGRRDFVTSRSINMHIAQQKRLGFTTHVETTPKGKK